MDIKEKQSQGELFEEFAKTRRQSRLQKYRLPYRTLTINLSSEKLVICIIVFIMSLIVFFSLGVEKGSKFARTPWEGKYESTLAPLDNKYLTELAGQYELRPKEEIPALVVSLKKDQTSIIESKKEKVAKSEEQKKYIIQVATFRQYNLAKKEADKLKRQGYQTLIFTKGKFSEICVGGFKLKDQASEHLMKLKKVYRDCFIKRI
jgi:hypothetical protein